MKTSFYSYIILFLCALSSFSVSAQNGTAYNPDAILTAPVDYHAIAAFLNSNGGAGGNKMAAPANNNNPANGVNPDSGVIVSPTFGAISGPRTVCNQDQQPVTYSVSISSVNGSPVQFYWFVPADWVILSGQHTNSITVMPGTQGGQVAVFAIGFCICTYSCVPVKVDCPTTPPCDKPIVSLAGPDTVCSFDFENLATYTATVTGGTATSFNWTVPADWTIISGAGTATIEVMAGFESGSVFVQAVNACGQTEASVYSTSVDCGTIFPLPVELVSFEAARSQTSVLLTWMTAQEKENARFDIERSTDGRTFAKVGEIKGNGTTNYRSTYKFIDDRAPKQMAYYRLKQIDFNGKFEYSGVRAVNGATGSKLALNAFPNPVVDVVTFDMEEGFEPTAVVRLVSVTGQQIWTGTAQQLSAQQNKLNIGHLNSGIYIATITSGEQTQSIRIVKN